MPEIGRCTFYDTQIQQTVFRDFVDIYAAIDYADKLPEHCITVWVRWCIPNANGKFVVDVDRTMAIR